MKNTMISLFAGVLLAASPAFADKASLKKDLQEALKLQEKRLHDLEAIHKTDGKLHGELRAAAKHREETSAQFEAKSKAFHDAAGLSTGEEATELEKFSTEMHTYAEHDKSFAAERQKAADIIEGQLKGVDEGIKNHKESIEHIKAHLAKLK